MRVDLKRIKLLFKAKTHSANSSSGQEEMNGIAQR
jgi:hypothetical protein